MKAAADGPMKGVLEYTDEPIVSSDIVKNPASSIFDSLLTVVMDETMVKLVAWYDNEWGYSNRVVDVAQKAVVKTLRDLGDLAGRRVLVRVDFNVPLDGRSGRRRHADPRGAADDRGAAPARRQDRARLAPRAAQGSRAVAVDGAGGGAAGRAACRSRDGRAGGGRRRRARARSTSLRDGELLLLENVRYEPGETKNDPELAAALASLADVYVDDAFGAAHRAHASTEGVARLVDERRPACCSSAR